MAEDVQRFIEYHHSQPGSREVTQIFVSGEGALVNGFDAYLGDLLGVAYAARNATTEVGKQQVQRA